MTPIKSLLLTFCVATCLLLCFEATLTNAQDISALTNCVKYSGTHIFQWTIATRPDGVTKYMRARYIRKGGYNGWSAVGFRYGRRWFDGKYDPDNESPPEKMGENTLPATIYMTFRSPTEDRHYFYELKASTNDVPSPVNPVDYLTKNVTVRSAVNGDIHMYFERDLVSTGKTNSRYYYDFDSTRADSNLMFATSPAAAINTYDDFSNSQHTAAKILRYNLVGTSGNEDAGQLGTCTSAEMTAAMPAYRTPKEIAQASTVPPKSASPSLSLGS